MPAYLVEFMRGEDVVSVRTVTAHTPLRAASFATEREIDLKVVDRSEWLRVTTPGRPPFEYGYADTRPLTDQ